MLDNAYHVEALLLILTLKKKNVKNYVYKLKAFMHIHRAKDDTLNSCIRLTFEINLVPRVLSYSSLTRVSLSLSRSEGLITWLQNRIISGKHCRVEDHCTPLLPVNFLSFWVCNLVRGGEWLPLQLFFQRRIRPVNFVWMFKKIPPS